MTIGLSFSSRAKLYFEVRPLYPEIIYSAFSALTPARELCWDVGCGNGQAAIGAAKFYNRVIATDPSSEQMLHRYQAENIDYRIAGTEAPFIEDGAVDLIISGCAAHWLERRRFYREAERVLKPGGILSVWSYYHPVLNSSIDAEIEHYYVGLCAPLVPPENNQYMNFYSALEFPDWEPIAAPADAIRIEWNLEQLLGFMGTFSTRVEYEKRYGCDPLEIVRPRIAEKWGDPEALKKVRLPLGFKSGRRPPA